MKRFSAVVLTAAASAILFAACSGDSGSYAPPTYPAADAADHDSYETHDAYGDYDGYDQEAEAVYGDGADYKYGDRAADDGAALPTFLTPDNERGIKLVYTVDMTLQTTEFAAGTRSLLRTVEDVGGFVRSTYVYGRSLYTPDEPRYARYTLSIPTEELAGFLVEMEDRYNLVVLSQDSREITKKYTGQSGELENLREREETLEARIADLDPVEDSATLRQLERELQTVRQQRNALSTSVAGMDNDVLYSTVTIQLYEVVDPDGLLNREEPSFGQRFATTAGNSWDGFVAFWQGALLVLLSALPVLVVLAVLAVVVILVRHALRKTGIAARLGKLRAKQANSPQPDKQSQAHTPTDDED